MAQQILGGHGYVKEWGVAQLVRDARIAQIYEGTNGIQALDLTGRKVVRDGGRTLKELLLVLADFEVDAKYESDVSEAFDRLRKVTDSMIARSNEDANLPGALSTDYLDLVGMTLCAWAWGVMAHHAKDDDFGGAKKQTARFFFARLLPRTLG